MGAKKLNRHNNFATGKIRNKRSSCSVTIPHFFCNLQKNPRLKHPKIMITCSLPANFSCRSAPRRPATPSRGGSGSFSYISISISYTDKDPVFRPRCSPVQGQMRASGILPEASMQFAMQTDKFCKDFSQTIKELISRYSAIMVSMMVPMALVLILRLSQASLSRGGILWSPPEPISRARQRMSAR